MLIALLASLSVVVPGPDIHSGLQGLSRALDLPTMAPLTPGAVQTFTANGRTREDVLRVAARRLGLAASVERPGAFEALRLEPAMHLNSTFAEYESGPSSWRNCLRRDGDRVAARTSAEAFFRVGDLAEAFPNTRIEVHWFLAPMRLAASTPAMDGGDFLALVAAATPGRLEKREGRYRLELDAGRLRALLVRTQGYYLNQVESDEERRLQELAEKITSQMPLDVIERVLTTRGGVTEVTFEVAFPEVAAATARYYAAVLANSNPLALRSTRAGANAWFLDFVDQTKPVQAVLIEPAALNIMFPGKKPGHWYLR